MNEHTSERLDARPKAGPDEHFGANAGSGREVPRVREVFLEIAELPVAERGAALDAACEGDAALRDEVERLLIAHEQAGGFLASPTAAKGIATLSSPITEGPGSRVGPYKILQLIGEGGFGSVFLAEQDKPVRRRVALKIIKLGMDTKQVVARFEAERQALAFMDHPHIARVFDGGATDTGRPYFVMEYVVGDPITPFADAHRLNIKQRLDLFIQVCMAVQHAHSKGIIHRDIKPGNVLVSMVDGKPHAKVIDFGIAKATALGGAGALTTKTLFTEHKQLIGTPEYMSPEQAEGSPDIDTRTDVYALGVLLYELLAGVTPFDAARLRSAAYAEMQKIIREEEPPKPSLRLMKRLPVHPLNSPALGTPSLRVGSPGTPSLREGSPPDGPALQSGDPGAPALQSRAEGGPALPSRDPLEALAAARQIEPSKLAASVKGELDWIVMKALEKDRLRRYSTPEALGDDVRRHLTGEPVVAAPPSLGYRVRKFVRKNKVAVRTAAMVTLALVVGLAATMWQMQKTRYHARQAEARSAELAVSEAKQRELAEAEAMARQRTDEKTVEANTAREQAEFDASIANITAARMAIAGHDPLHARKLLDACPPHRREFEWRLTNAQSDNSILAWKGIDGAGVTCFAWHPTGDRILCGMSDGTVRLIH